MKDTIISIIKKYTDAEVTEEKSFKNDLGMSSFDMFCIMNDIQEKNIRINYSDLVDVKTVGDLIGVLSKPMDD